MKLSNENIISDTDARIRQKSARVPLPLSEQDEELLQAMVEYVRRSQDDDLCRQENLTPAVGLAAIQLGIPKQMIAVVVPEDDDTVLEAALVNPRIISNSIQNSYLENGEGCLSVPEFHEGHVFRSARIKVRGYDLLQGREVVIKASGYFAIALQHEIDHLSGILYYDRIDPEDPWKEDPGAKII